MLILTRIKILDKPSTYARANYKDVLFDLGGTLIKTAEIPEIFRQILEIYGVIVTVNQIIEAHKVTENKVDARAE